MRKSLFRLMRVAVVWTVVVLLSVDAAVACRWLRTQRVCQAVPSCHMSISGMLGTCQSPVQKSGKAWLAPSTDEMEVPEPPMAPEIEPEPPAVEAKPVDRPKEMPEEPVAPKKTKSPVKAAEEA